MLDILIGGDPGLTARVGTWLESWGLRPAVLPRGTHPASVPAGRAAAVIYAAGEGFHGLPERRSGCAVVPLLLVGQAPGAELRDAAWLRVADPGPDGAALAAALRPLLESSLAGAGEANHFRDLVNHELRTPLTAAGTALQMLARQLERAGGPSLDLVDLALRNLRRLERTLDWACDHLAAGICANGATAASPAPLTELLEDLDAIDAPLPVTWSSGPGDWEHETWIDRDAWRRLLRELLRAVALLVPDQPVHLDVAQLANAEQTSPSALLLVMHLPQASPAPLPEHAAAEDIADHLRRLLSFTVSPGLVRSMDLRLDVMRLSDHVRLRVMLPLGTAAPAALVC